MHSAGYCTQIEYDHGLGQGHCARQRMRLRICIANRAFAEQKIGILQHG